MMLTRFKDFLLEKAVNESMVYYSPKFRTLLQKLDKNDENEIAKGLLDAEVTDIKPDLTFIDLVPDKQDYISFTTMRNALKIINKKHSHVSDTIEKGIKDKPEVIKLVNAIYKHSGLDEIFKKSRNPLRVGKFVNKVMPGKFNTKEVEEFVNKFKALIESSGERFEIVEGEKIAFWYREENYLERYKGNLGNSCMKNKGDSMFEIYVKNPEVCKMLILLEDDKLIGRALIWKLHSAKASNNDKVLPNDLYFMDRQYTSNESDIEKFKNYAREKGWAFKTRNSHNSVEGITFNGEEFDADIVVSLKEERYNRYPYMDTFRMFNPNNSYLFNIDADEIDSGDKEYQDFYVLDHTDGTYREIETGVWSDWHDRMIDEEDAVYSDRLDTFLERDSAVQVNSGSRRYHGWYPDDYEDIYYDEELEEYIHIDDSVYSDNYGRYIFSETAVRAINEIDSDGEPMGYDDNWFYEGDNNIISIHDLDHTSWYDRLSDKFHSWIDIGYVEKDLLISDYKNNWILKYFSNTVYKIEPKEDVVIDLNDITNYLTEIDARLLGYNLDEDSARVMDEFEYYKNLEDILPQLYKLLVTELKRIDEELAGGQKRLVFDEKEERRYNSNLGSESRELKKIISGIKYELYLDLDV